MPATNASAVPAAANRPAVVDVRRLPTVAGAAATTQALVARAHRGIDRLEAWAHGSPARSLVSRVFVTVAGPLVVLAGFAMTVLPGPGLVVVALGLALLALEYDWARSALRWMGQLLSRARDTAVPRHGTPLRRAVGVAAAGAFFAVTFALTAGVTAYLSAYALW